MTHRMFTVLVATLLVSSGACAAGDLDALDTTSEALDSEALDPISDEPLEQEIAAAAAPAVNCANPSSNGKPCNDGLFCTVEDRCRAGVCVGEERPCDSVVGFCEVATCNETTDSCLPALREPGCVDRCDTNKLEKHYRKGWKRGFEAVSKAWDRKRNNSCDRTEQFMDLIVERVAKAEQLADSDANVKAHRRCKNAGVVDGAYAALDAIQTFCDQVCFLDGEFVGKLAATTYCEMAIGADGPLDVVEWLRGPLNLCGLNYEIACDSTFIGESISYANDQGACEPLTTGAFEPAWDASREKSCDYQISGPH